MKTIQEIHDQLVQFEAENKKIFATTSLQSHSIPLLHILSLSKTTISIYFVNTGFLFPETLQFRDQIAKDLRIQITTLESSIPKIQQRNSHGNFYFTDDPDRCCFLNKVDPVDRLLPQFDVWISGVRKDQTKNRAAMKHLEPGRENCLRFHPLLSWSHEEVERYSAENNLPRHPLESQGYTSIGCQPCTVKTLARQGRWSGLRKTECGLHLNRKDPQEGGRQ